MIQVENNVALTFEDFKTEVINDYKIAMNSRECSLLGRREVLTGKAKFGIFGDGKEVAQIAAAKFFQNGDWRSGYYRDQTLMLASGIGTIENYFAQLYADPDINNDPFSMGRQMTSHYTTRNYDEEGNICNLIEQKNTATDMAPTAGQMPRSLGLAYASKLFRNEKSLQSFTHLSDKGNEVCFTTIGDASTSEGHFWETINAAGVLQVPLVIFVWDDGYGISVPKEYQTTKGSISKALQGFEKEEGTNGFYIACVKGWDYMGMTEVFKEGIQLARETHTPVLFHVEELTQPQGHSTSGSHERYKSPERLDWEKEWDCLKQIKKWILANHLSTVEELEKIEIDAKANVKTGRDIAWEKYITPLLDQKKIALSILENIMNQDGAPVSEIKKLIAGLTVNKEPNRKNIIQVLQRGLLFCNDSNCEPIKLYLAKLLAENKELYSSHLYFEGKNSVSNIKTIAPIITDASPIVNGYEILNKYFDQLFAAKSNVVAFGEDVGNIGDVNQGFSGLQKKHGALRVTDTGIRELTIVGQAIGLALRGIKPIAEIQYLDYLLYGLQPLSDDVCTVHYRSGGKQSIPLIIRTRGHRLEGIWHSGSPMGMMINSLRGMYICVPRNMVQAASMYNTMMQSNNPAIIVECLNGYRLKEKLPENLLEMQVELGVPEILQEGTDITIVSYGSTLRIIDEAIKLVKHKNISCELIDVQTLLPFDKNHVILSSLKKTNRIVFIDEDVPHGGTAYMFNKVMEEQGGYKYLDVAPRTISAKEHRPPYGTDGDYFSKPNAEEIVTTLIDMMAE